MESKEKKELQRYEEFIDSCLEHIKYSFTREFREVSYDASGLYEGYTVEQKFRSLLRENIGVFFLDKNTQTTEYMLGSVDCEPTQEVKSAIIATGLNKNGKLKIDIPLSCLEITEELKEILRKERKYQNLPASILNNKLLRNNENTELREYLITLFHIHNLKATTDDFNYDDNENFRLCWERIIDDSNGSGSELEGILVTNVAKGILESNIDYLPTTTQIAYLELLNFDSMMSRRESNNTDETSNTNQVQVLCNWFEAANLLDERYVEPYMVAFTDLIVESMTPSVVNKPVTLQKRQDN